MKCSIVVRTSNEGKHLDRLLRRIYKQRLLEEKEVIIVDHPRSTDDTLSIASKYPVRIIKVDTGSFSFGQSLNIGCAESKGEFVVFISAHAYPQDELWLENLLKPFKDERIALVYGRHVGDETTSFCEHQIFAKNFPEVSNLNLKVPYSNNANAAIRRAVWDKVKYDETLPGLEDIDWANKILVLGHKIAYVSEAVIVHIHNEGFWKIYQRYFREAVARRRIFPYEKVTFLDFIRLFCGGCLNDLCQAKKERVVISCLAEIVLFRVAQNLGGYWGYGIGRKLSEAVTSRHMSRF